MARGGLLAIWPMAIWPLAIWMSAALVLGGGGSPSPGNELLLQSLAAACAAALLLGPWRLERIRAFPPVSGACWTCAALVLALPALQLVPLPPGIWQSLPGRALAEASLALVGAADNWRPWSLFPAYTLASLLAMIPPVILMLVISRLPPAMRWQIVAVAVVTIMAGLAVGALQLASGQQGELRFYAQSNAGWLNGFQANRNAQSDVLLIGMVAATALLATLRDSGRQISWFVAAALIGLMALGVVLTGSRMGMALLCLVLPVCGILWFGMQRRVFFAAAILLPASAAGAWLLRDSTTLDRAFGRFGQESDSRSELWADGLQAIALYWPWGAGMGSASPILIALERLEVLDVARPNRVHSDYLELLIEGGLPAALLLISVAGVLALAVMRRMRSKDIGDRREILAAAAIDRCGRWRWRISRPLPQE